MRTIRLRTCRCELQGWGTRSLDITRTLSTSGNAPTEVYNKAALLDVFRRGSRSNYISHVGSSLIVFHLSIDTTRANIS